MRRNWLYPILLFTMVVAVFVWAVIILWSDEVDRNKCIDRYDVCISTNDGWKPYHGTD